MNRHILIALLTLFACVEGLAQSDSAPSGDQNDSRTDVVMLTDGSFVRGHLVEYIVDSHLIIINLEGERREFKANRIHQVNSKLPKIVLPKTGGYINTTDVGVLMTGQPWQGARGTFSFHLVNGWQFEKLGIAGIGTGVEFINQTMNIPLYADVKIPLAKGSVMPYVGAFAGYNFSTHTDSSAEDNIWSTYRAYNGGPMWGAQFGLMNYTKDRFGITFSAGYQHHRMRSTYEDGFWNGFEWKTHIVEEEMRIHRVRIAMGIVFR